MHAYFFSRPFNLNEVLVKLKAFSSEPRLIDWEHIIINKVDFQYESQPSLADVTDDEMDHFGKEAVKFLGDILYQLAAKEKQMTGTRMIE